jgi:hypothetical protein
MNRISLLDIKKEKQQSYSRKANDIIPLGKISPISSAISQTLDVIVFMVFGIAVTKNPDLYL